MIKKVDKINRILPCQMVDLMTIWQLSCQVFQLYAIR